MSTRLIPRRISKTVYAAEVSEGVGARVRRSVGSMGLAKYTPFLLLDHFKVEKNAGFPDHPHRGQETVTYMLKGHFDHEDFTGSAGTIGPGDLQFMTAGKGIMHAEMPVPDGTDEVAEGMQLWVDLPDQLRNVDPRYRDLRAKEIPIAKPNDKVEIKVISGSSHGVDSVQDLAYTPLWFFDIFIKPGGSVQQIIPHGWNVLAYVLGGECEVEGKIVKEFHALTYETEGDCVEFHVPEDSKRPAQIIVIAGEILKQNTVHHGPFVASSREGIIKAVYDYQAGANGFERAVNWESKIGKLLR